jgi:NTP pyrophosphatase (non-canonical NTP hydrolase)
VAEANSVAARLSVACRGAIKLWGAASQWRMVQEECGELVAAINRFDRGRTVTVELAEEIADVTILMEQARLMLGSEVVDEAIERKLSRLEGRIVASEAKRAG